MLCYVHWCSSWILLFFLSHLPHLSFILIILADLLSCDVVKHTCKNADLEVVELLSQKLIEALQGNSMNKHPRQISGKTHICTCMYTVYAHACVHTNECTYIYIHTAPSLTSLWLKDILVYCYVRVCVSLNFGHKTAKRLTFLSSPVISLQFTPILFHSI